MDQELSNIVTLGILQHSDIGVTPAQDLVGAIIDSVSQRNALVEHLRAAYRMSGAPGSAEAHRGFAVALLEAALDTGVLHKDIADRLREAKDLLEASTLDRWRSDAFAGAIWRFIEAKHGNGVVVKDHEDRVLRACYEAFNSTVDADGIDSVTIDVAELLLGGGMGDITLRPRTPSDGADSA